MKPRNSVILLAAVVLFAFAGCRPAAGISVVEARTPTLDGLASLHGEARVENAGARDVTVESALVTVRYRDRELGTARLMLPVEIPAGGVSDIRYDLALDGVTLSSLRTLQSRVFVNPDAFTVDVGVWVRWGGVRKKIEMKDVELDRIMGIIATFAG